MRSDGFPEGTITSARIEIDINADTEFYLWEWESKDSITRDQFKDILLSSKDNGNSLGFSMSAYTAEELGLFP